MSFRQQSIPVTSHHAQLLSNGRYAVMLTTAGSGFSRWGDLAVTRWREDPTCDGWGSYVLLRDSSSGAVWSACQQPGGGDSAAHTAMFSDGRAEFVRRDETVTTALDVAVASDRDAELRRVTITNHGDTARDITLTSYAELVLGSAAADAGHPAFSKLFVQTESVEDGRILLATRRRRAPGEPAVWAAHFAVAEGQESGAFEFETDRARFLGRGRTLRDARAMQDSGALSNTAGSVLDPIFSLRQRVRVEPGASARVTFWTLVSDARDAVLALCASLRTPDACEQGARRSCRTRGRGTRAVRHRSRASRAVWASGHPAVVRRCSLAFDAGGARTRQGRPSRALDVWYLRRSSDRVAAHRWRVWPRPRPRAAARAVVLAIAAAGSGRGSAQLRDRERR